MDVSPIFSGYIPFKYRHFPLNHGFMEEKGVLRYQLPTPCDASASVPPNPPNPEKTPTELGWLSENITPCQPTKKSSGPQRKEIHRENAEMPGSNHSTFWKKKTIQNFVIESTVLPQMRAFLKGLSSASRMRGTQTGRNLIQPRLRMLTKQLKPPRQQKYSTGIGCFWGFLKCCWLWCWDL